MSSQPITNSPSKWMAELESEDIEMLKGKCFFSNIFCVPTSVVVKQDDFGQK